MLRIRRAEISTAGSNEAMMTRAAASATDLVFLDLEDAVAPNEKVASRAKAVHALRTHGRGRKTRAVRVNNTKTQWCYEDIIHVVEEAGDCLDVMDRPGPGDADYHHRRRPHRQVTTVFRPSACGPF